MKNIIYLLLILIFTGNIYSQLNWETNIKIENNLGFIIDNIYIGAKEGATNGLDKELGEEDLPTIEPPVPDIFAYLTLQNGDELLWSNRDYRSVPNDKDKFSYEYLLYINYGAGKSIDISWTEFGPDVDSAIIEDIYPDAEVFRFNMKETKTIHLEQKYTKDHKITIWYNKKGNNVIDNKEKNDIFVYPNPAENNIILQNAILGEAVEIYNEFGVCVLKIDNYNGIINLETMAQGLYIIKSKNSITKFIKI